jgi:hypothetical protein
MPNNDIPAIMAVADSLAPSALTEQQRQDALTAIATLRAIAPRFLDSAEQIITAGVPCEGLLRVTLDGARLSSANLTICKALWPLERAAREQGIAAMGREQVNRKD